MPRTHGGEEVIHSDKLPLPCAEVCKQQQTMLAPRVSFINSPFLQNRTLYTPSSFASWSTERIAPSDSLPVISSSGTSNIWRTCPFKRDSVLVVQRAKVVIPGWVAQSSTPLHRETSNRRGLPAEYRGARCPHGRARVSRRTMWPSPTPICLLTALAGHKATHLRV